MTQILALNECPSASLAEALADFESRFHYPLGQDRWFSISHGDDYTRFFRAIGHARCFVAKRNESVIGVISVTHCPLRQPDGNVTEAAYLSDLKISQGDGRTLLRLLRDSAAWARKSLTTPGFSIVMGGTAREPTAYTGRLDIPPYTRLAELMVLRIPCAASAERDEAVTASLDRVRSAHEMLTAGQFSTVGGTPTTRSQMSPIGLTLSDGMACGILEDTRRCKLLYRDDGTEMISAHLSNFGYRTAADAATLIRAAVRRCVPLRIPALFVSIPQSQSAALLNRLAIEDVVQAPATVFGHGLPSGHDWYVNTSEI